MKQKSILLTFDIEDWFQVENFKKYISYSSWDSKEFRAEKNVHEILNILDNSKRPIKATFFILGWIAKRYPDLVLEIHKRGHEVASHGINHQLCYEQSFEDMKLDLERSKALLEEIIGNQVLGYRAPSFSITDRTIDLIRQAGYLYDSSYNSFERHGRYGSLNLPETTEKDSSFYKLSHSFFEIPISNLRLGNTVIPWGGGGYFRLLPSFVHQTGVNRILRRSQCYTFYMHPWEIDPGQPRVSNASFSEKFKHYININKAQRKFERFIACNSSHSFQTCGEFIREQESEINELAISRDKKE